MHTLFNAFVPKGANRFAGISVKDLYEHFILAYDP